MRFSEIVRGKAYALRAWFRMVWFLRNGGKVWSCYRRSSPIPALEFRRGFTLQHGKWDTPISLLHEVFAEGLYHRYLRVEPKGVLVDIGANIGAVALDFATRWPQLEVHAYEPNPSTFETLNRNLQDNHLGERVVLFNEAVAGSIGSFDLWTEMLSVGSSGYLPDPPSSAKQVAVACVDLATVFQRVGDRRIFLLKIDAEGAETDILGQSTGLCFDQVQQVAVECHEKIRPGARTACQEVLERHGFRCKTHRIYEADGTDMLYAWKR